MPNLRRNAIITGAASGLGRALALRLARDGWHIAVCDLNDAGSAETLRLVQAAGGSGQVEHLDVTSSQAWADLRDRLQSQWRQIDLLVNNAGVAGAGEVGKFSLDDWRWILDINLFNGIYGCHTFVDWLKQNPRGAHIINTASMAAIASAPGMAGYNVSKAGMVSLSETLYAELLSHKVGVTVVCPAFFATNLLKEGRWAQDNLKKVAERAFHVSKLTAEQVADLTIRAMHRKQLYVLAPFSSRVQWWFKRLRPQGFLKQVGKLIEKANSSAERQLAREAAAQPKPAVERPREPAGHRQRMLHLKSPSSERWLRLVDQHLDEILIDHAHCEKKAAATALNLIFAYVERTEFTRALTEIVNEELEHFNLVLDLLARRGVRFRRLPPSNYGRQLNELVRKQEPGKAIDRCLVAALIEARSCERFALLRDHVSDPELADFYGGLFESEARHHATYVQFAQLFGSQDQVFARLEELSQQEAQIIAQGDTLPRMHS